MKMRLHVNLWLTALSLFSMSLQAQNLAPEMSLSADGHMLYTGKSSPTGLYDSTLIRSVYINFPQANYWTLMQQNYQTRTPIMANMVVDGVNYDSVGVGFKGNTSYMGTGNSQKKSFGVDMNWLVSGQDLMGYKTLNFNNAYQDESFLREVFYLHQIRRHIPAAKANFIHLYLNNQDWGLYPNVQQINKDLLEQWFMSNDGANWRAHVRTTGGPGPGPGGGWGDGTAALNYLGADTTTYKTYYTLKSSDIANPWTYLVNGCNALNNTTIANLPTVLPQFFDVDRVLWFLACEIAFMDDDSYVYKGKMDYYVYYEPETGHLIPLEFDGNSVMPTSTTWSPFYNANLVNYPLLNKLLQVPAYRQRYLAHLRTIINESLDPAKTNVILDNYKAQIDALVQSDPKKLYTYNAFVSEVTTLKNWITNRRTYLLSNSEVAQVAPSIPTVSYANIQNQAWTAPAAGELAHVTAQVSSTNGIDHVYLHYTTGLVGNFTSLTMFDDGQHNDGGAGDGVYGADIPGQTAGEWVRFYIEAAAGNTAKSVAFSPVGAEHDVYIYQVQTQQSAVTGVVINEVMASNSNTVTDNFGEYDDWIEIYNTNSFAVDLSGFFLSDNPQNLNKFEIAQGTTLAPFEYKIFWADEDSSQGPNHCNFKLSASAETLMLLDNNLELVDSMSWGAQQTDMGYARVPNGTGPFSIQSPTFQANNEPNGTEDIVALAASMQVYPNPASDLLHVLLQNGPEGNQLIEVYDLTGRFVEQAQGSGLIELNTSQWPNGVYLIRHGALTQKVVITHE